MQNFSAPAPERGSALSGNYEQNIGHVAERVAAERERTEFRKVPERKVVKEALKREPTSRLSSVSDGDEGAPQQPQDASGGISLLPDYFQGGSDVGMADAVERLAQTALHGDLKKSLREARKLSPYLEDAFHDALIDKVLPLMKERGVL